MTMTYNRKIKKGSNWNNKYTILISNMLQEIQVECLRMKKRINKNSLMKVFKKAQKLKSMPLSNSLRY